MAKFSDVSFERSPQSVRFHSRVMHTRKLLSIPSAENLELSKVLSFKPGITLHASPAAGNGSFLVSTFQVPSTSFSKSSVHFLNALVAANTLCPSEPAK